jgi:hypothetical protein
VSTDTFVMPFGKHKGKPLAEVPAGYLTWLLENVPDLYPKTREAIEAFVRPHDATEQPPPTSDAPRRQATRQPRAKAEPTAATCAVCGLGGSVARPLVHASCANDGEVPF